MYLHLPLILSLVATAAPSSAESNLLSRLHRRAIKHSSGFARDLRLTFNGVRSEQPPALANARVYCVSSPNSGLGDPPAIPSPNPTSPAQPANGTSTRGSSSPSSSGSSAAPTGGASLPPSPWKLLQSYQGKSFFDGWDFFTGADPTHGQVTYIDRGTAQSAGLIDVNSAGNIIMRVETTAKVPVTRQSVRITTKQSYTGGLVIMDSVHMPTGCGTWPAFWSNGPNWPNGGEIDILEGVHDYTNNQMTIHTNAGCNLASNSGFSGDLVGGTNCAALDTGNQGCGIRSKDANSYGAPFNNIGGGVYAMKWDNDGVAVWWFPRNNIPRDISGNQPQPSNWGTPQSFWPASGCDPFAFFHDHSAIFDTTLCGDWASGVWNSAGIPGQEQSCAQRTGVSTCEEFIRNNGAAFNDAYWEVSYVKIYQQS
ncbi:concanavalin A-like lectin/glucanase domain-containing protein [Cristinia sonorae]|uniref:Concanavalin A-like lectin/glucanase domain-containing protein n=1 Tax=Cristinia sonorae TaxID=1940300 RepID=A0A8K0UQN4_9AGAR|nr:concanavalin A-like lectin/glucanase domain-containing protein [Cristinia sonorae]